MQITEEQFLKLPEKYKKYFKSEIKKIRVSPGFEIRDQIGWLYGSGFPKSHNISKAIDKHMGKDGIIVGKREHPTLKDKSKVDRQSTHQYHGGNSIKDEWDIIAPESEEAKQWNGWGTALKPAWEPIVVARKPLEDNLTIAENVLKHGTGGININASRVPLDKDVDASQLRTMNRSKREEDTNGQSWGLSKNQGDNPQVVREDGRFPANIIHDGSEEVLEEFAKYGERVSGRMTPEHKINESENRAMSGKNYARKSTKVFEASTGTAARFFYSAKASNEDRAGSNHSTVKPLSLMSYLCKLVTPPNGKILDPFAGSGTTGQSAIESGFYPILIEKEPEYQKDIENRMAKFEEDTYYTLFE